MTGIPADVRRASPRELSDALSALGAYAEPPTDAQLAAAELAEGRAACRELSASVLTRVETAWAAAAPPTADDCTITADGRRIDTKEKLLAWIAECEAQRPR